MGKLDEIRQRVENRQGKQFFIAEPEAFAWDAVQWLLSEVDRLTVLHKREIIVTGEYAQRVIGLTARAEAAEARADAAIADLNHLTYEGAKCEICKHYLDENCITCEFEWRGQQEAGKEKNDAEKQIVEF